MTTTISYYSLPKINHGSSTRILSCCTWLRGGALIMVSNSSHELVHWQIFPDAYHSQERCGFILHKTTTSASIICSEQYLQVVIACRSLKCGNWAEVGSNYSMRSENGLQFIFLIIYLDISVTLSWTHGHNFKQKKIVDSKLSVQIKNRWHDCARFNKSFETKSHTTIFQRYIFLYGNTF